MAANTLYKQVPLLVVDLIFFRKNYAMLATVFTGAFAFNLGFNSTMNSVWDTINQGRQWKDIRAKYVTEGDEDEE